MSNEKRTAVCMMVRCMDPFQVESVCPHYVGGGASRLISMGDHAGRRVKLCVHALDGGSSIEVCDVPDVVRAALRSIQSEEMPNPPTPPSSQIQG